MYSDNLFAERARSSMRSGAGPFRSLITAAYVLRQLVPLIMAAP